MQKSELDNIIKLRHLLKEREEISLLLLDIDNFSNINNSYGVKCADTVLEKIENILYTFNFKDIEIYKLESDEFALVYIKEYNLNHLKELAQTLVSFFNESEIELDDDLILNVSLSIGIASGKGMSSLNKARLAIKELREFTKGGYNVYDIESPYVQNINNNVYWIHKIKESVANDDIIAFFQPIINNKTQKIEKYECLARIDDNGKYISPYHFMEAAKETRILSLMTKSMIKKSCKIFSKNTYEFSINITNDDLQLNYLEAYLLRNTNLFNINPSRISLELLEDIPSLGKDIIIEQLNSLKSRGFKISIDDFGSESSNFSRLLEFKPDYIKIDGSFIKNILTDEKSQFITEGIVSIAHKMGIELIAEFVHSKEVQDKIHSLGIEYSQGYYHGEPSKKLIDNK